MIDLSSQSSEVQLPFNIGKKYRFATKRMTNCAIGELVYIYYTSNIVAFVITDELGTSKIGCHIDDLVVCEEVKNVGIN